MSSASYFPNLVGCHSESKQCPPRVRLHHWHPRSASSPKQNPASRALHCSSRFHKNTRCQFHPPPAVPRSSNRALPSPPRFQKSPRVSPRGRRSCHPGWAMTSCWTSGTTCICVSFLLCSGTVASGQHCIDDNTTSASMSELGGTPAAQSVWRTGSSLSNIRKKGTAKANKVTESLSVYISKNFFRNSTASTVSPGTVAAGVVAVLIFLSHVFCEFVLLPLPQKMAELRFA